MASTQTSVLTINGGSSSIKFALFEAGESPRRGLHGEIDRVGLPGTGLTFNEGGGSGEKQGQVDVPAEASAVEFLLDWLAKREGFASVAAVGHRVVHGMTHVVPERIEQGLIEELRRIAPYDPEHLPGEIDLIEAFRSRFPRLPQMACFDTAFHRELPRVARLLPIPRRYEAMGVRRYGFHGLSYEYLMEELARIDGKVAQGRVVLAHLGNGASLAAVFDGKCVDTSMGFTPTAGLVMSSRCGDLDPGLVSYLARTEGRTAEQFHHMVNHQSGLLGVSETSSDMRDLLARQKDDVRAAEAVALFCYQAKKWIGGFAAALGGIDTLVFSAGIGEHCGLVRARICEGLGFLGIELEPTRNSKNAPIISSQASKATVRVIPTDEELMIARSVCRGFGIGMPKKQN